MFGGQKEAQDERRERSKCLKDEFSAKSGRVSGKRPWNLRLLFLTLGATALLVSSMLAGSAECQEQLTVESRQQKDNDDLNDAIKYLEKLDKYFSQMARPR